MITLELLTAALPKTPKARCELFLDPLQQTLTHYDITSPERIAAFLAQIFHESGCLRYVREIWGPTTAQAHYEGRKDLGNLRPGDGRRFLGRGLIQITGRANYRSVSAALGVDFESKPELLEQPLYACLSAGWFWVSRNLNVLADEGDFVGITKKINGGTNGLEDRKAHWERLKALLAMQDPAAQTQAIELKEAPMLPFIAAALPAIVDAVPELIKVFTDQGKTVPERNVAAAEKVVNIAVDALGAANAQEAVERIQADPSARETVREAVTSRWYEIAESGGGGIAGARDFNAAVAKAGEPFWMLPAFWVTVLLLPALYLVLGAVLFKEGFSEEVKIMVVTAVVSGGLGSITGFWLGSSASSQRKDAAKGIKNG